MGGRSGTDPGKMKGSRRPGSAGRGTFPAHARDEHVNLVVILVALLKRTLGAILGSVLQADSALGNNRCPEILNRSTTLGLHCSTYLLPRAEMCRRQRCRRRAPLVVARLSSASGG